MWFAKLQRDFPGQRFRVYLNVDDEPVVRFHRVYHDEPVWLDALAKRHSAAGALILDTHAPSTPPSVLRSESARANKFLRGRTVGRVFRHRAKEFGIEFEDGWRLFVDGPGALELSVTEGARRKPAARAR
jgi:hypothetical protein